MFAKKIPAAFLIHSITLAEVTTAAGAFGGRTVTNGKKINRVRLVTPKHKITVSRSDEDYSVSAVMLWQPGSSTECELKVGGYIKHDGVLYEIAAVENHYEAQRLHHKEVQLICR